MPRLGNSKKRYLNFSERPPELVKGKTLFVPNLANYFRWLHECAGWGKEDCDEQSTNDFSFDGKILDQVSQRILGRRLEKIYFPAAYTGKVAKALSDAGHEVFASDISYYWTKHLESLGLRSERRSFDQLPDEKFDAVVMFEPYCLSSTLSGYIGALKIIEKGIPLVVFYTSMFAMYSKIFGSGVHPGIAKIQTYCSAKGANFQTLGYDYGGRYKRLSPFKEYGAFDVNLLSPTKPATERARLDLSVLDAVQNKEIISILELTKELHQKPSKIAAALLRLQEVLKEPYIVEFCQRFYNTQLIV